jgi:ATP-binding cassette subfamily B protein
MYNRKLLHFIQHFLKPYKWYFFGLLLTGVIFGIQEALLPYALKLIINSLAHYSGDKSKILSVVAIPAGLFILFFSLESVNYRITDWLRLKMIPKIREDITLSMFSYLKKHSHHYFQVNFGGSLVNKIKDMSDGVVSILLKLDQTCTNVFGLIIATFAMFLVNPLFAGILLGWAIVFVILSLFFTDHIRNKSYAFSTNQTKLAGSILDSIGNMINVRLFARENFEISLIKKATSQTAESDRTLQILILKMRALQDVTIILLMFLMLGGLIFMYEKGKVSIGDFAFVLTLSIAIFKSIWFLANQFVQFSEDSGKCMQAWTLIATKHGVVDVPNATPLLVTKGLIEFKKVCFRYNNRKQIFDNLEITIEPGSKTGLVGFSGSGKSTFVNLILRFFNVKSGKILIDGQDISKVTQESLRRSIAMIPQDTSLFHRSLMENIRYGRLDATDEEVMEASKRAHCHEFIIQLPEGYNTSVGERGVKISGGQRQRIAIARAMLKKAPILILDEATSALDSVTEKYIQDGLNLLMQSSTSIVIAHRLSTLAEMDQILVFSKGRIIEAGAHQDLIQAGGYYAKLWEMQASGFLIDDEE